MTKKSVSPSWREAIGLRGRVMPLSMRFGLIALCISSIVVLTRTYAADKVAAVKPTMGDTVAESAYAWQIFAQTVRPSGDPKAPLVFESWQEQCDLQSALCASSATKAATKTTTKTTTKPSTMPATKTATPNARVRHAHGSALGMAIRNGGHNDSGVGCNPMNTKGFAPIAPATNVAPNAIFCEEVFANPAESAFILANHLNTFSGQHAYGNVKFPAASIEIKVDWAPQSSFVKPFSCNDPSLYIETIEFEGQPTQCYAMVGMHISSKVLPNWLWATFEPNNALTNPNRCKEKLYGLCNDPWGTTSAKPYGPGATPAQSPALAALMRNFNLPEAFSNYYLTGAQTQFVKNGVATQLGNSFVEFNASVAPQTASCITCHAYAYAGISQNDFGGPPPGWPNIGHACNKPGATKNCLPAASAGPNQTTEDFSWLLGLMALVTETEQGTSAKPASGYAQKKLK